MHRSDRKHPTTPPSDIQKKLQLCKQNFIKSQEICGQLTVFLKQDQHKLYPSPAASVPPLDMPPMSSMMRHSPPDMPSPPSCDPNPTAAARAANDSGFVAKYLPTSFPLPPSSFAVQKTVQTSGAHKREENIYQDATCGQPRISGCLRERHNSQNVLQSSFWLMSATKGTIYKFRESAFAESHSVPNGQQKGTADCHTRGAGSTWNSRLMDACSTFWFYVISHSDGVGGYSTSHLLPRSVSRKTAKRAKLRNR